MNNAIHSASVPSLVVSKLDDVAQPGSAISKSSHDGRSVIQDKMFRPPGALHFTLGVMHLEDPKQLEKSMKMLEALDLKSIFAAIDISDGLDNTRGAAPLTINLTSVNALPSETDTRLLYTAPPPASPATARLLAIAKSLRQPFLTAGLLEDEKRPLLLHATIFNTIYGKAKGRRRKGFGEKLQTSRLIEEMQGFCFANDVRIERIAICEMGAKPVEGEEGMRYREITGRALPTSIVGEQQEDES